MSRLQGAAPVHFIDEKVKVNARYYGEFAYKSCHRLTHCFLEASSFS